MLRLYSILKLEKCWNFLETSSPFTLADDGGAVQQVSASFSTSQQQTAKKKSHTQVIKRK